MNPQHLFMKPQHIIESPNIHVRQLWRSIYLANNLGSPSGWDIVSVVLYVILLLDWT